jgi:hypothetical protein
MKLVAVVYTDQKRPPLSDDERRALAAVACVKLIRPVREEEAA